MIFEWMTDPAAWAGLATLIVLEIVLGIDNLVFIAILADKLPEHQRDKARLLGLSLALFMRLALLASIAWIVGLTEPLFSVLGFEFSARDLILLLGGFFLLFKGTMELHERLEGQSGHGQAKVVPAVFWQVIVQIVVLDAVFSLDSVITAVGMVDELSVMMIAVVVAIAVMMVSSKPLMAFVSRHPTVVILCLGFLMMIGFSLIVEGFGFHLPKGYLYAAIGFSILIEILNQTARRNREKLLTTGNLRERTAEAVLTLLGGTRAAGALGESEEAIAQRAAESQIFAPEEQAMTQGVLSLAERRASSVMTPRTRIEWLDLDASPDEQRQRLLGMTHSRLLLARGQLDDFVAVASARDLLRDLLEHGQIDLEGSLHQPLVVHESMDVLRLTEELRKSAVPVAVVLNEFGALEGLVTPIDVLEAIAGEFPDADEPTVGAERAEDGSWIADAAIDIRQVSQLIGVDLVDEDERYATLGGYVFTRLGRLPSVGERVLAAGLALEVTEMDGRNIAKVRIAQVDENEPADEEAAANRNTATGSQ